MITVRGLARQFAVRGRTVDAVKGIDFDVAAGELVGFLGPDGAGKTTTLRMLTTLLRPTGGTATVGGCDLLTDPQGVRRRIGYVAQGGSTWPESRVAEEIELQARLYGLSRSEARRPGALLAEVAHRRISSPRPREHMTYEAARRPASSTAGGSTGEWQRGLVAVMVTA